MDIAYSLKNAMAMMNKRNHPNKPNTDRALPYFDDVGMIFRERRAIYAPNVYDVEIEIADSETGEFTNTYFNCPCRRSDPVSPTATSIQHPDRFIIITPIRPIGFLHFGTKMRFNILKGKGKDTWIAVSTENMTSGIPMAQARKCNRMYRYADIYGKVISEPFVLEDMNVTSIDANTGSVATGIQVERDASPCIMQLNERTKGFSNESRMILGGMGYNVRGMNNHAREFTEDDGSARILYFTLYRVNTHNHNDDIVNNIVNAYLNKWHITLSDNELTVLPDDKFSLSAFAFRNGEPPGMDVPYGFEWEIEDESVATIDATTSNGDTCELRANNIGTTNIICRLRENTDIFTTCALNVASTAVDNYTIGFTSAVPTFLARHNSIIVDCSVMNNGIVQPIPVLFEISGVPNGYVTISDRTDNSFKLTCNASYGSPLIIRCNAITPIGELRLEHRIALINF